MSRRARPTSQRLPLRRIAVFILIAAFVLLGANAFVWATMSHFLALPHGGAWQAASALVLLSFLGATVLGRNHSGFPLRVLYAASATAVGFLNYAFFAAFACWLGTGAIVLFRLPLDERTMALGCFALAAAVTGYGIVNAATIRTTRVTIALPHLPEVWKKRTAALVTDIHLGHIAGPFYLRRVLAKLRGLAPDIVLVSGDMFDGTTAGIDRLAAPWREFTAPMGTWFVTGNHDEFANRRIYLDALAKTGVRILNNERVDIDGLQLLGVHDHEAGDPATFRAALEQMRIDRDRPSILLNHQPGILKVAAEAGVSLQLSGHTHGGQFWPWTLIVRRIYRAHAQGHSRVGDLQLYTSNGTGAWGPPLRVGTRSEIILLRFVAA